MPVGDNKRGKLKLAAIVIGVGVLATSIAGSSQSPVESTSKSIAQPGIHATKERGEGRAIWKREEWFYRPRQAGAVGKMASLRAEAVEHRRLQESYQGREESDPQWVCKGPSSSNFGGWTFGKVSGRIPALAKDWGQNILYVGSASGGVWKSYDDGASWLPIFDSAGTQTVGALAVDQSTSAIWVGTGENTTYWCEGYFGIGLLRSQDGGSTWQIRNGSGSSTLEELSEFCAISIDPRDSGKLVVGGMTKNCISGSYTSGGIYSTADSGATWAKRLSGYITSLFRDPNYPDTLWAGVYYGGVYKSTDGGATWIQQTANGIPYGSTNCPGRVEVTVAPTDSKYVYALFQRNGAAGHLHAEVWRSTDGGATWAERSSGTSACDGQCSYNMALRVSYASRETVYRGTIQLFKSTNGGSTWTNLTGSWGSAQKVHQDTHFLLMNPANPNEFYVGCDGGVWKSGDGGSNFANLNSNLNLTQFYAVGVHPTSDEIIIGGAQDNSSLARTASDTWDVQDVTGDGFVGIIDPGNPNRVYITSYPYGNYPSVYRSSSGVLGPFNDYITGSGSGISATSRIEWVTPYASDPVSSNNLYLGTYRIYASKNGGDSWTAGGPSDMTSGGDNDITTVNVCRSNSQYIYAGTTDSRIWVSSNKGGVWTQISTGLPARQINDIDPDPAAPARAFCAVSGFNTPHLYEFDGSSWNPIGSGLPNVPANTVLALSDTEILVGTDVGIYSSTDRGQSFLPFNPGLPLGLVVTDLQYNSTTHTVTAGTYGRGAWQYTLAPPGEVAASEASAVMWAGQTAQRLQWGQAATATGYRVFRGDGAHVHDLPTGAAACLAYQGAAADTGETLAATPAQGEFFWYLAVGYNGVGEGSPGAGTSTPRLLTGKATCATP